MAKKDEEDFFGRFTDNFRKGSEKTVKQMAKLVKKEVEKNAGVEDEHTPNWLKRQRHPYGIGTPKSGKSRGPVPHKEPLVHKVTGNLSDNVEIFAGNRKDELSVGVDEDKVPYVVWVVDGSTKMIARDFLAYSLLNVRKKLRKLVIKNFKKAHKKSTNI